MKTKPIIIQCCLVLLFVLLSGPVFSQWEEGQVNVRFSIPEIAIVDIEPNINSVEFEIIPSSVAGGAPQVNQITQESLWINYSSSVANNGVTRSIKAQISQGTIPNGVSLLLEASAPSMYGSANQGQSTGQTSINYTPQAIITGIGNCYTGDGTNRGHELTFQLNISNFNEIEAFDETEFTILYTITDN